MSDLAKTLKEEAAILAEPIVGGSPAGSDISYDEDFEVVRLEMDKLTNMAGELPDWQRVVQQGLQLLKNRSKDMRLLVWVAAAQTKKEGPRGFALGLAQMGAVLGAHWDGMFPPIKRAKARGNLASWLGDLVLAEFADYLPTAKDREFFDAIEALFGEVDELLTDKLGDKYQGMGAIRSLLREKGRMIPEAAAEPAPVAAAQAALPVKQVVAAPLPVAAPAALAAPVAPVTPAVTGAADVLPALRTMGKGIVDSARHIRLAEPASAWGFRLNRIGAWLAVKQAPPAEGSKTKIPPPQPGDVARLENLVQSQQWSELVNQAEGMVSRFIFWLDLHRLIATGLERLGDTHQAARKTVISEVLTFIEAQPAVLNLAFADGTPFADEATKAWLEEEQAKLGGAGSSQAGNQQLDEEQEELKARFESARELVGSGKIAEGLGLAIQLSRRSADARSQFRARLATAQMALKASRPDLARPLLEGLVMDAHEHHLEGWEPELCVELFLSLLRARTAKGVQSQAVVVGPSNEEVFDRLCRLDPAAAMKMALG